MDIFSNFSDLFISVWSKGIRGVDIFQILIGIGIFFIFLIFRGIISKVIIKRLEAISKRTTNKLDDTFVHAMEGPARFLPIVLGFFIASYYMSFADDGRAIVDTINRTLITILIFWVIHQIIEPISYILSGLDKMLTRELVGWIIKSLKILIFILGLAAVLELWGIKIGPIIAGLGLFGVAVALGAQDLFKNLISGILVLVEKRFKIGDWILVEGIIEGIVEKIGFRSTVLRKFDKSLAIIPNFQFAENAVINISETTNWRIDWAITLQYDTTVDQLKKDSLTYASDRVKLISKIYFNIQRDTLITQKPQQLQISKPDEIESNHPDHNPNLWSLKCYDLFKYLWDNYHTSTKRQITNIWFFLNEYDKIDYNLKSTKEKYTEFIFKNYDIELKNVADQQISFDLDDGVTVNYKKFETVVAKIK